MGRGIKTQSFIHVKISYEIIHRCMHRIADEQWLLFSKLQPGGA